MHDNDKNTANSASMPYNRAIKDLASDERPREKALAHGFESLTAPELLAILIGSGSRGESVVDLCRRILGDCGNKLYNLARLSIADLMNRYRGVGEAKAITILAALELARRYHSENFDDMPQITDSRVAFRYISDSIRHLPHEEFWLITLNRAKRVTGKYRISRGGTAATVVDVKIVLKTAIEHLADGIIVAHNHPSGTCRPSGNDNEVTRKLREGCRLIDIEMLDHIIVAGENYFSYADNGV